MDKKRERVLLTAIFLFWFSVYTYPSFLSSYAENTLGASSVMLGLIVGSYGFTQMVLRIPLGIVSDAIKKRKIFVMLGFGASMLASAGLALVSKMTGTHNEGLALATLLFRGLSGVAASTWVTFSVLYSAGCPPEHTGAAMSRITLPQYFSQIAAMLLGSYIMNAFGAMWAFLLATAAGLAGLLIISRVEDVPPSGSGMFSVKSFLDVLKDRDLITGTVLSTILHLVCWGTVLGFVQNWAEAGVAGFKSEYLGWLSVAYLLPNAVISGVSGGVLTRRLGGRAVLTGGFIITAVACALYPFVSTVLTLMLVQVVFGVGMGLIIPPTMAYAIQNIAEERRGAAMGIYQAIYGLGMFLGPVLAGAVIEKWTVAGDKLPGYAANFYMCAAISVLGGITAFVMTRKRRG